MHDLLTRLPLLLLFAGAYLVSRLLAVTGLTEVLACRALERSHGKAAGLFAQVLAVSALLSFFIPNAVTVLALLPVIRRLRDGFVAAGAESRAITTTLTLLVIDGANIGGMGSLVGSPANLLLVGALDVLEIPGGDKVGFANWFVWSLPLVAVLGCAAWLIITYLFTPARVRGLSPPLASNPAACRLTPRSRAAARLAAGFMSFWMLLSIAAEGFRLPALPQLALAVAFSLWFGWAVFLRRRTPEQGGNGGYNGHGAGPLLHPRDLLSGLPWRGLGFLALLVGVAVTVQALGLPEHVAGLVRRLPLAELSGFKLFLITTLAVMLLTELLSNTVVATAFFGLTALADPGHALGLMLAISAASTCAFMTPVATPCNALAYGEMRGTRLRIMLASGLLLNLSAALAFSLWLPFILPILYG